MLGHRGIAEPGIAQAIAQATAVVLVLALPLNMYAQPASAEPVAPNRDRTKAPTLVWLAGDVPDADWQMARAQMRSQGWEMQLHFEPHALLEAHADTHAQTLLLQDLQAKMASAEKALAELRWQAARKAVDEVVAKGPRLGGHPKLNALLGRAFRLQGRLALYAAKAGLKHTDGEDVPWEEIAERAFFQAVAWEPAFVPPPSLWPPATRLRYADARALHTQGARGSLSLEIEPPYGEVFWDGAAKGQGVQTLDKLQPGRHALHVQAPGHLAWSGWLEHPGKELWQKRALKLQRAAKVSAKQAMLAAFWQASRGGADAIEPALWGALIEQTGADAVVQISAGIEHGNVGARSLHLRLWRVSQDARAVLLDDVRIFDAFVDVVKRVQARLRATDVAALGRVATSDLNWKTTGLQGGGKASAAAKMEAASKEDASVSWWVWLVGGVGASVALGLTTYFLVDGLRPQEPGLDLYLGTGQALRGANERAMPDDWAKAAPRP